MMGTVLRGGEFLVPAPVQKKHGRRSGSWGGLPEHLQSTQGTLEQGSEPTNAHIGPCDEMATHPGVDLTVVHGGLTPASQK